MYGHAKCIEPLMRSASGEGADALDGRGRTPLMLSSLNGEEAAVKALLAGGASPVAVDGKLGRNAMMFAIMGSREAAMRALADACEDGPVLPNGLRGARPDFRAKGKASSTEAAPQRSVDWLHAVDKRGQTCEAIAADGEVAEVLGELKKSAAAKDAAKEQAEAAKAAAEEAKKVAAAEKAEAEKAARAARIEEQRKRDETAAEKVAMERKLASELKMASEAEVDAAQATAAVPGSFKSGVKGTNKKLGSLLARAAASQAAAAGAPPPSFAQPKKKKKMGSFLSVLRGATESKAAEKKEKELRAAFDVFDTDGSGSLSCSELKAVLTRPGGGAALTDAEVMAIIEEFDVNRDGVSVRRVATRTPFA